MTAGAIDLTERHDLRGGQPVWSAGHDTVLPSDPLPRSCDVAIIGSGVMGAIVGERLSADGHDVAFLDRRPPAHGSTAASTAQVMWGMDLPLRDLAARIGFEQAARRWRRVHSSVRALAERIDALGIACDRADRPTVYLAGDVLDEAGLREECALHRRIDLPTTFLSAEETAARFGIAPRASLASDGGFEVDPEKLTLGMLAKARGRGARVCHPRDVTALAPDGDGVFLTLDDGGQVRAGAVVLAGGYERARMFLPDAFTLLSTFVMATGPQDSLPWRERAMIWEASDPYLYIRADAEGRIIAGGEDEDFHDTIHRNDLIPAKAGAISAKSAAVLGLSRPLPIRHQWAAMFGSSPDSLPAIGRAAIMDNVWLTAGFGGNGIAFAGLAAEILSSGMAGREDPDADCFDPYRFDKG